ncbi:MAG: chemotaxis protein CheD [Hungatella sp.]
MDKQLNVGIADMKMTRYEGTIITYALGSCIGICLYDPMIKLGALVHIMLPQVGNMDPANVFKYADTGLTETLRKMYAFGAVKNRMMAKIAGGAKMFDIPGDATFGNIGLRNVESVRSELRREGIMLRGEETGANYARTMLLDVSNGQVVVRTYGRKEIIM